MKLTDKQQKFIELFSKNATNIKRTCEDVDISRQTYYDWLDKFDTFKKAVEDEKEGMVDFAESMLFSNIKKGRERSIFFFLKTHAKHRGYSQDAITDQSIGLQDYAKLIKETNENRK